MVKESRQMSDAQGVSAQDDTAPLAANPSARPKGERASSGRLVRLLATVGALIFAYAAWLPWAVGSPADVKQTPLFIDPSNAIAVLGIFKLGSITPSQFIVDGFLVLGLLLAPLLWRPADSLLGAIATHVFGLWVIFVTLLIVAFGLSPTVTGNRVTLSYPLGGPTDGQTLVHFTGQFALGYWLAVAALVPLWIAVIGLLASEWRRHAFWHLPGNDEGTPRSIIQLPGASVLNLGLIIWAFGFFSAGWAASNCNQTPLFFSSCRGVPANSALFAWFDLATSKFAVSSANDPNILLLLDPGIARYAIGILLGVGAAMIFLGVWLRSVTRGFCVWTTLWLVAAVAIVGLAYAGIGATNTLVGGYWTVQSGVWITLLGLILALIGLAILSASVVFRRQVE
jgi:hypothetical protein